MFAWGNAKGRIRSALFWGKDSTFFLSLICHERLLREGIMPIKVEECATLVCFRLKSGNKRMALCVGMCACIKKTDRISQIM